MMAAIAKELAKAIHRIMKFTVIAPPGCEKSAFVRRVAVLFFGSCDQVAAQGASPWRFNLPSVMETSGIARPETTSWWSL